LGRQDKSRIRQWRLTLEKREGRRSGRSSGEVREIKKEILICSFFFFFGFSSCSTRNRGMFQGLFQGCVRDEILSVFAPFLIYFLTLIGGKIPGIPWKKKMI